MLYRINGISSCCKFHLKQKDDAKINIKITWILCIIINIRIDDYDKQLKSLDYNITIITLYILLLKTTKSFKNKAVENKVELIKWL